MFPLVHDWDSVSLPASILAAAEQPSLSHLRVFETFPEDTTMRYTFSILRQALYAARSDQVPSQDLRILFNSVDYRIANLVCSSKESPAQHMLLATAQLFIAYNIRDVHIDCLVPGILISRLVGYLRDRLEAILHLKAYWCGILWCLFTCLASTSPGSEQWRFFRNALSQVIQTAEITEPEQLKVIVQRFLWDDDRSELAFQEYQPIVFPAITENTGEHHENSEVPLLISEEFKRSLNHFRHFGV